LAAHVDTLAQFVVVHQRFLERREEPRGELLVRGVIEVRLQAGTIVEFEQRDERIVRSHQLLIRSTVRDAPADPRPSNRRDLLERCGQRVDQTFTLHIAQICLWAEQHNVSDHRKIPGPPEGGPS